MEDSPRVMSSYSTLSIIMSVIAQFSEYYCEYSEYY